MNGRAVNKKIFSALAQRQAACRQRGKRVRQSGWIAWCIWACLPWVWGCPSASTLRGDLDTLGRRAQLVRERGAYRCAPAALARAEAHLDFLDHELREGGLLRAQHHHRLATVHLEEAWAITDPRKCASKRVVVDLTGGDKDGDGIPDDVDQCVDEPEDQDGFEDSDGCPDPDNDADTVLDGDDKCPVVAGPPSNQGCPMADRDGDGIGDTEDACPDIPEDLDGNEDEDGCPESDASDRDGDGIEDSLDSCPDAAEDRDLFQDEDGCPDPDNDMDTVLDTEDTCPLEPGPPENQGCPATDRDGDGVMDDVDQCPDVPGKPPKGCPRRVLVVKTNDSIEIKKQIRFATNRYAITGNISFQILDQVAAVLTTNPDIKIVIEGHTDSVGSASSNLKLSDGRANAVAEALVSRGVAAERLTSIGYGESRPIASNRSRKGRAENRRVAFNIVKDKTEAEKAEAKPADAPPAADTNK